MLAKNDFQSSPHHPSTLPKLQKLRNQLVKKGLVPHMDYCRHCIFYLVEKILTY